MLTLFSFFIMSGNAIAQAPDSVTVKFTVIDSTETFPNVKLKGSVLDNWGTLVDMTKDGTPTGADHWSVSLKLQVDSSYEWGAIIDDGSEWGIWLPSYATDSTTNRAISIASDGTATGDSIMKVTLDTTDVIFSVNMSNEIAQGNFDPATQDVNLMGTATDWSAGTAMSDPDGDNIYTDTIDNLAGYYEFKYRIGSDGWEGISGDRNMFTGYNDGDPWTMDTVWFNNYNPNADTTSIQFIVVDSTQYYDSLFFKGSVYNNWESIPMYDDGETDGDTLANDHVWVVKIDTVPGGKTYEWGVEDQNQNWLIQGDNRQFTLNDDGSFASGDTTYTIPAWGEKTVTFAVNLNCLINNGVVVDTTRLAVNVDGYPAAELTYADTGVYTGAVQRFDQGEELAYWYTVGYEQEGYDAYEEYPGFDENRSLVVPATDTMIDPPEIFNDDDPSVSQCPYIGFFAKEVIFTVVDGDNAPVDGASVELSGYDPVTTDANGEAVINNVYYSDALDYTVTADGYEDATGQMQVDDLEETMQVQLTAIPDAIDDVDNSNLTVYPNPAKNTISVKSDLDIDKIVIYDVIGKRIKVVEDHFKYIPISDIREGVYFISVYNKGEVIGTRKIIKK
jgi:hypothetical protein